MDQSWISRAIGTRESIQLYGDSNTLQNDDCARINREGKFKVPRIQWKWPDTAKPMGQNQSNS